MGNMAQATQSIAAFTTNCQASRSKASLPIVFTIFGLLYFASWATLVWSWVP
jgi:hypothetical protein